jgi:hypothetical protein
MFKKSTIASLLFLVALCYLVSPWFFEKNLFFNELLSFAGIYLLVFKRFRIGRDPISISVILLLLWCGVHAIVSLFRMDSLYYYLRNSVIIYSIFAFFVGYYCWPYLGTFIHKIRTLLRLYIGIFLFIPLSRLFFERFGMATLFPALFKKAGRWTLFLLVVINIIYGINYDSATAFLIAAFLFFLLLSPGYRFFKQTMILAFFVFILFFIYINPNLNIINNNYNYYSDAAIHEVMDSHPLLGLDGNSTWRLVLWEQVIVDHFPHNLAGIGLGTPMMRYFPVEDYTKLDTLPYVLGAHNSFIYLFGRLGIVYLILIGLVYVTVFKEYFYFKKYYYANSQVFLFWSFFAITMIALFNPALESPIYAAGYWLVLGLVARSVHQRRISFTHQQPAA